MLLGAIMLPVTSLGAAPANSNSVVIVRGEDALKLLAGNTLRSDPLADTAGNIFVNRWKIENGELCRTMNDEPATFICGSPGVMLQEPKQPDHQVAPRFCVGDGGIGAGYIAKGNAFAIDFGKSAEK